ncbi:hypothetical protein BDZ85DRAFT_254259 [Elsinoe ampelina]|uniref:Uncharacterized protein n=1 Tax=Elsinoe ampelina TaxID=302913 RepID=A0A6A6GNS2_9PEZI|nr:hypothetical protein BDZ85DRAFT_254259 [Elsinoe ampelina]
MSCHASDTNNPGTGNYVRVTNGSYGLIEEVPDDYVPRRINRPPVERDLTPFDSLTPITSRRYNKDAANNTRDSGMGESFISSIAPQDMGLTPARNNSASPCPAPTNAAAAATLGAPQDTPQEHLPPPTIKRERDAEGDTEDPTNTPGGVSLKKKAKKRLTPAEKEEKKRLQELRLKRMEELKAQGGASLDQPFALDDD